MPLRRVPFSSLFLGFPYRSTVSSSRRSRQRFATRAFAPSRADACKRNMRSALEILREHIAPPMPVSKEKPPADAVRLRLTSCLWGVHQDGSATVSPLPSHTLTLTHPPSLPSSLPSFLCIRVGNDGSPEQCHPCREYVAQRSDCRARRGLLMAVQCSYMFARTQ